MIKLYLPFMDYRFLNVEDTPRNQLAQHPALNQSECHYSHFPAFSQVIG